MTKPALHCSFSYCRLKDAPLFFSIGLGISFLGAALNALSFPSEMAATPLTGILDFMVTSSICWSNSVTGIVPGLLSPFSAGDNRNQAFAFEIKKLSKK